MNNGVSDRPYEKVRGLHESEHYLKGSTYWYLSSTKKTFPTPRYKYHGWVSSTLNHVSEELNSFWFSYTGLELSVRCLERFLPLLKSLNKYQNKPCSPLCKHRYVWFITLMTGLRIMSVSNSLQDTQMHSRIKWNYSGLICRLYPRNIGDPLYVKQRIKKGWGRLPPFHF
jgi:hypothetical protein